MKLWPPCSTSICVSPDCQTSRAHAQIQKRLSLAVAPLAAAAMEPRASGNGCNVNLPPIINPFLPMPNSEASTRCGQTVSRTCRGTAAPWLRITCFQLPISARAGSVLPHPGQSSMSTNPGCALSYVHGSMPRWDMASQGAWRRLYMLSAEDATAQIQYDRRHHRNFGKPVPFLPLNQQTSSCARRPLGATS